MQYRKFDIYEKKRLIITYHGNGKSETRVEVIFQLSYERRFLGVYGIRTVEIVQETY